MNNCPVPQREAMPAIRENWSLVIGSLVIFPRSHRALARRFLDRLGRRIAERIQHGFCAPGIAAMQLLKRLPKGSEPKIRLPFRAIHAIEECGQVDELRPRIHEIQIEDVLTGHG